MLATNLQSALLWTIRPERRSLAVQVTASPDESALLDAAQHGNQLAFKALVRAYEAGVLATCGRLLGSRSAAEDAAQEAFIRAWRALSGFDRKAKFSTWLYRIAVNVSLNHLRKRKPNDEFADDVAVEDDAAPKTPSALHEQDQLEQAVNAAVEGLSESLRIAVVLVLMQGMSHAEAGEVLGIPEGTVSWRVHEARRKLRTSLKDWLDASVDAREGTRR